MQRAAQSAKEVVPPLRPSFALYVNIKVYYFSISISDRTRNFLIYTRSRTAATVKPKPGVVSPRHRTGRKKERERERESEVAVFAALVLQTKPTPTCVRLFLLLFFPSSLVSAASLIPSSLRRSLSIIRNGDYIRKMLLKFTTRLLLRLIGSDRIVFGDVFLLVSHGRFSSSRNCPRCFLLYAIYDDSRAYSIFRVSLVRLHGAVFGFNGPCRYAVAGWHCCTGWNAATSYQSHWKDVIIYIDGACAILRGARS